MAAAPRHDGGAQADSELPSEVLDFVRGALGAAATLSRIAGDASTRRFYRVSSKGDTFVLMVQDGAFGPNSGQLSNHRILEEIGAPVPRLLAHQADLGVVLFEDLGDLSLQRYALQDMEGNPRHVRNLYLQACDLITLMQGKGTAALRPEDFASRHALDRERFLFELDHFDRHFVRGLRQKVPSPSQERLLRNLYEDLAARCDALPRTFCHRDFQSRNLLVRDGSLALIDFQDARMGPYTYDPASLLRDSSWDLPEDLVEESLGRLEATCAARLAVGGEEFRRDFELMALQRNIKDLGTFGYMATVRGRREYLDYVPRTQASIRRTMLSGRRYHEIYGAFGSLVLD